MRIKKVVFTWKRIESDPVEYANMDKMDIVFEENLEKPVIFIDAGIVKIEDGSFEIDCKEVLKKISEIDFELASDLKYPNDYSGDAWELVVNDQKYFGVLEDPHYVVRIKRIIRFSAIQVFANKKLAKYLKG